MDESTVLRGAMVAALALLLCAKLPRELRNYCWFMLLYQFIPQNLHSAGWWRTVWLPLEVVNTILGAAVCVELWNMATHKVTFWEERTTLLLCAAFTASTVCLAWSHWIPKNWFQSFVTVREYYRIGLMVVAFVVVARVCWIDPVAMKPATRRMVTFWLLWLTCLAVTGTAGEGGIAWRFLGQTDWNWMMLRTVPTAIRIVSAVCLFFSLRRLRGTTLDRPIA